MAVPNMSYFHVSRVHPDTTQENMVEFLKDDFPEVVCDKISAKYPDLYSSFKVGLYATNAEKFLVASTWTTGTRINEDSSCHIIEDDACKEQLNVNNIKIFHLNIKGIKDKVDSLNMFLNCKNVDICLSEYWIQQKMVLTEMNIYGYQLVSAYCRPSRIHGGVCMLVKKNILCKAIDVESFSLEASAEFCALELNQQNMIIIVVYRSCLADVSIFFDKFEELLNSVSSKYEKIVILGDFNIYFNIPNEKYIMEFSSLIARYGLYATISENTRFGITGDSCIDILTNLPESRILTGVADPAIKSDHIGQYIEINLELSKKTSKSKYRKITKKRA
nr:unnamed protein product [Callosobruchus analis]